MLGPLTGVFIGWVQVTAAALVWMAWGEPDMYFRNGWDGVTLSYAMLTIGGAFAGTLYGIILSFVEHNGRRIRLRLAIPLLAAIALVMTGITTALSFHYGDLRWSSFDAMAIVFLGLALSIATSRRNS